MQPPYFKPIADKASKPPCLESNGFLPGMQATEVQFVGARVQARLVQGDVRPPCCKHSDFSDAGHCLSDWRYS